MASASAPNVATDAIASALGVSRSISPPGGTWATWADLPMDILEIIFVKLIGPALVPAQVCYRWCISAMSFPRPVVLCPVQSPLQPGRMELVVPTTVMSRGACRSFSYITLPALGLRSHLDLRLIGGSPSVPLFIDDCHKSLVARRFVGPPEGLPNALPETLLSINLPQGVASHDIYCGIFAPGEEINKIKGVLVATKSSIFGILVKDTRASSHWSSVEMPLVRRQKDKEDPKFTAATPFGGMTYFLDHTHRLLRCNMDGLDEIHTDELFANTKEFLNLSITPLKTWILHLGEPNDRLLCLRYEYNRPSCYRFVAYDVVLGAEVRVWRVLREPRDFCIFIGWGGAQAFAYLHPERIGLSSGFIYEAEKGMMSYRLGEVYRDNAMPPHESLTRPFSIWIHHLSSLPFVPLPPRRGIMAEALPPPPPLALPPSPPGDGDDDAGD